MYRSFVRHWRPAGAAAVVLVLTLIGAGAQAAEALLAKKVTVDIPAQRLTSALIALSKQAEIQVVMSSDVVDGLRTEGVRGEMPLGDAIAALLQGTKLEFRTTGANTIGVGNARGAMRPVASEGDLRLVQAGSEKGAAAASLAANRTGDEGKNTNSVEEIIVTATKRKESVQSIPMSVAVISRDDIARRGMTGIEDLRMVAGVSEIDRGGPQSNALVIRGITTSPQFENFNGGATVATYFGETPMTASGGIGAGGTDLRPVDIERIELLRGPQGTAYGSSSLGGTLRLIPAQPKLGAFSGNIASSYSNTSGYGSDNTMVQGVLNVPVVSDKVAVRLVGYRYDESGYYHNGAGNDPATLAWADSFGLRDYVQGWVRGDRGRLVTTGARLSALWKATDKLSLTATLLTQKIEQDGLPQATHGKFEQLTVPLAPQTQAVVGGGGSEVFSNRVDVANLVLDYDLTWASLTTSVSSVNSQSLAGFGTGLIDVFSIAIGPSSTLYKSDFESLTAELRLASQLSGPFQFLAGLYYEDIPEKYLQHSGDWPGDPAENIYGTDPMFRSRRSRELDQRAIFGELSYAITERLIAKAGARYFMYDKEQRAILDGGLVGVPLGSLDGRPTVLQSDDSGTTYSASLSYKLMRDSLLYASYAEGFRLGRPDTGLVPYRTLCDQDNDGIVDNTSISIDSTTQVNPDYLKQYELGAKFALFERRLLVDSAVYHIDWKGLPLRNILEGCPGAYIANVGAATSTGAELQATWLVAEGWKLDFGVGYTKAELSADAPNLVPPAFDGDRLPGSPKVNANFAIQYDFRISGHPAFARADSFYTGEFYGDLLQTPVLKAGGYTKIDARAGVTFGNLDAELFVRNVTNNDAYTWRGISSGPSPFIGFRLRPRVIGVQLGYHF